MESTNHRSFLFILFLNLMILLYCFRTYESFNQDSSIAVAQKPCSY